MNKAILLLDGSSAMNLSYELTPNRLLAIRPVIEQLVREFLARSALSVLSIVVMRDGVAYRLSPLTSDVNSLMDVLDRGYFQVGGSGVASLQNGLKVCLAELNHRRRYDKTPGSIMLLSAFLGSIDPDDVLKTIDAVAALRVRCHVVSLVGAPHILTHLVSATQGELRCPMSRGDISGAIMGLLDVAQIQDAPDLVPVGFLDRHSLGSHHEEGVCGRCPQCAVPMGKHLILPTTCPLCGLLLTTPQMVLRSALMGNPPVLHHITLDQEAVDDGSAAPSQACCGCGLRLGATFAAESVDAHRCGECQSVYCSSCAFSVQRGLYVCPMCY